MKAPSFFKGLWYLLFLNILIKPVWIFGVDRQVQNVTGYAAYGAYFALLNLSMVFSFITDAGLSTMANRQIASGQTMNIKQLLGLKIILSVAYAIIVIAVAMASGVAVSRILISVIMIQVLTAFYVFLRSIITAHQLFTTDAWLSVIDKAMMLVVFIPLLYVTFLKVHITIASFLYVQIACTLVAITIASIIIAQRKLFAQKGVLQKNSSILKAMVPYAAVVLLMSAHNRLDGFLLERLHANGAYEAGIYAAAYRLLDAANMMGFLVASFLVPYIARNLSNKILVGQTVIFLRDVLLLAGTCGAVFIMVFAVPVQQWLYPLTTFYTAHVLQLCMAVLPAYLMLHIYGSLLTAAAQLKVFIALLFISVLLNILLNVFLIPRYGAAGCCMAALCSQYFCAIVVYIAATKKMIIGYGIKNLMAVMGASAILFALFYYGHKLFINPILALLAGGMLVLLLMFALLPVKKYFVSLR